MAQVFQEILGIPVCKEFQPSKRFVSFVNPYTIYKLSVSDISSEDISRITFYADGIFLCWVSKLLFGTNLSRVSFDFTSIADSVFRELNNKQGSVALVGGADCVSQHFSMLIGNRYPDLNVVYARNGFFQDVGEMEEVAGLITSMSPDAVIVGMGVVAQERMILSLMNVGFKGSAYTCGGFFDQTVQAGGDYYPHWIDRFNLRWLYRLVKEPKRLAKRYFLDYTISALCIFLCRSKRVWKKRV